MILETKSISIKTVHNFRKCNYHSESFNHVLNYFLQPGKCFLSIDSLTFFRCTQSVEKKEGSPFFSCEKMKDQKKKKKKLCLIYRQIHIIQTYCLFAHTSQIKGGHPTFPFRNWIQLRMGYMWYLQEHQIC